MDKKNTQRPTITRQQQPKYTQKYKKPNSLKDKILRGLSKLSSHFFLRNIVVAVCTIIVLVCIAWLLLNNFTRNGESYKVPDLTGLNVGQVQELLSQADMKLIIDDSVYVGELDPGIITEQNPKANSKVKSGRKIFVIINSTTPRMAEIPHITGYSLRQAKSILMNKGFSVEKLIYRPDMATNNVIEQEYKGRDIIKNSKVQARVGDGITLIIGRRRGDPLPLVPKVVGLTLSEAKGRLIDDGFNTGEVIASGKINKTQLNSAFVYRQVPSQETRLDYGGRVTLYLTTDINLVNSSSQNIDNQLRRAKEDAVNDAPLK